MAENYEPGKWDAVVCNGFAAVNVLSSTNVEELGWDYTEMELDPTGTCGLFDGMLLDWDDDTPDERREHEEYFPDAFTVGARILADDWDHELSNDEVRSRCFLIIEHADQFIFTYDGRDSEPVHRTDVHLDGDAMTLDPVKGTPAHNGAQAHGGDRHPADLAKAASAAANRTAGSHTDEAGGIKH